MNIDYTQSYIIKQPYTEGIIAFLNVELSSVQNPNDSGDIYSFPNLKDLIDTLITFLFYPCEDTSLERLANKVIIGLSAFAKDQIEVKDLPPAIEDMATGFEILLKKIAYVRYQGDTVRLYGDAVSYNGLLNTTLGGLLYGEVSKKNKNAPVLSAPLVTFSKSSSNIRDMIYSHCNSIRNEIHHAYQPSLLKLIHSCQILMAGYLFALEENLKFIRAEIDPLFKYMKKIEEMFSIWDVRYVDLTGKEKQSSILNTYPELEAFEWLEDKDHVQSNNSSMEIGEFLSQEEAIPKRDKVTVSDLPNIHPKLWLIGEPGAGKSTTLQRLAWQRANELLGVAVLNKPCPVYLPANQLNDSDPIKKTIADELSVSIQVVDDYLIKDKLWLLIDGFNEINSTSQDIISARVMQLFQEYPNQTGILTSRKHGFKEIDTSPVFEILPLTNEMILSYLKKNMPSEEKGVMFYNNFLSRDEQMMDLVRNPLMIHILINVAQRERPSANRGKLLRQFSYYIFDREKKQSNIDAVTKEEALSCIAYSIRLHGEINAPRVLINQWIANFIQQWKLSFGVLDLLQELLDNHILEIDDDARVSFFHELILEYFVALELKRRYELTNTIDSVCFQQSKWFEAVIMMSSLLDNADTLIETIYEHNVLLATRCIPGVPSVSKEIKGKLLYHAELNILSDDATLSDRVIALTALLEWGEHEALALVNQTYPKIKENRILAKALSNCQRPVTAALRLLNYGISEPAMAFECLKIFETHSENNELINASVVAKAQALLLDDPIQPRHLILLGNIGISSSVKDYIITKVSKIVEYTDILSPLWIQAISILVKNNVIYDYQDVILNRIQSAVITNPKIYYSFFTACKALNVFPDLKSLSLSLAQQCLSKSYYGMAYKFIKELNLKDQITHDVIYPYLVKMAHEAKLGILIEFSNIYTELNIQPLLVISVDGLIKAGNIQELLSCRKNIDSIIAERAFDIKNILVNSINSEMNPNETYRFIKKRIKSLLLNDIFINCGVIINYDSKRNFGFILNFNDSKSCFFHITFVQLCDRAYIKEGMIVEYVIVDDPKHKNGFQAKQIKILNKIC